MAEEEGGETPRAAASEIFARELLRGQVALVTGGGTGLGRASALELARCGARVVIAGRREEVLRDAALQIDAGGQEGLGRRGELAGEGAGGELPARGGGTGGGTEWLVGDVRERAEAERLVAETLARCGRLDVLVNNAGGQYFTPAEGIAAKGWRAVWRLNVDGIANMAEAAFAGAMRAARRGRIINVTLSPHHGMPGMAHSGAARAAVEALTREHAREWAQHGIAVAAIAAGHFDTEAMQKYPDVVRAGMARSVPAQRLGDVREHAWLVALLASPLGAAFNGSVVTLDGARDNWLGPWPPQGMVGESGEVPTEARRPG